MDSVFSPLMASKFQTDRPLIPIDAITTALDALEQPVGQSITNATETATNRILSRRLDLTAIDALTWPVGGQIQASIAQMWRSGIALGGDHVWAEMQAAVPEPVRQRVEGATFELDAQVLSAIASLLTGEPGVFIPLGIEQAILSRVLAIAGNYSRDLLTEIKGHLIAAAVPIDGQIIPRSELEARIQKTLNIGRARAETIARNELTSAYNAGRLQVMRRSTLVTHVRFIGIIDSRQTEICRSRSGMIVSIADTATISANSPALHHRCFPAGTLVTMADGTQRPIEKVKVSDKVYTATASMVQNVYDVMATSVVGHLTRLTFEDGTTITATPDHPIWNGVRFVAARLFGEDSYAYRSNRSGLRIPEEMGRNKSRRAGMVVSGNSDAIRSFSRIDRSALQDLEQGACGDRGRAQSIGEGWQGEAETMGGIQTPLSRDAQALQRGTDGQRRHRKAAGDSQVPCAGMAEDEQHHTKGSIGSYQESMDSCSDRSAGNDVSPDEGADWAARYSRKNWHEESSGFSANEAIEPSAYAGSSAKDSSVQTGERFRLYEGNSAKRCGNKDGQRDNLCRRTEPSIRQELSAGAKLQVPGRGPIGNSSYSALPICVGSELCKIPESLGSPLGIRGEGVPVAGRRNLSPGLLPAVTEPLGRGEGANAGEGAAEDRTVQRGLSRHEIGNLRQAEARSDTPVFWDIHPVRVIKVETIPFSGVVYNLSVENDEVYFANGILTHNCRSLLSPVMGEVSELHQTWIDDPDRAWNNRTLEPLPQGWRN